jgi:hypothetical protein
VALVSCPPQTVCFVAPTGVLLHRTAQVLAIPPYGHCLWQCFTLTLLPYCSTVLCAPAVQSCVYLQYSLVLFCSTVLCAPAVQFWAVAQRTCLCAAFVLGPSTCLLTNPPSTFPPFPTAWACSARPHTTSLSRTAQQSRPSCR